MSLYDVIVSRRTVRQYRSEPVPRTMLERLVNAGRLAPSAANRQPLEFVVVDDGEVCGRIFPCLKWAAYIAPEGDPKPGQEPTAYVVVLVNTAIRDTMYEWDSGAAVENVLLAAWEEGVGTCWLISVDKDTIHDILAVPDSFRVDSVIALGYAAEEPVAEDMTDSVKYWKDESGRLHVPKRVLSSVIHFNKF
ncbi:MAG: nitroreductase family protein [Candidatus Aminicenantaceae bacterium]|jgi:nitroreductase